MKEGNQITAWALCRVEYLQADVAVLLAIHLLFLYWSGLSKHSSCKLHISSCYLVNTTLLVWPYSTLTIGIEKFELLQQHHWSSLISKYFLTSYKFIIWMPLNEDKLFSQVKCAIQVYLWWRNDMNVCYVTILIMHLLLFSHTYILQSTHNLHIKNKLI